MEQYFYATFLVGLLTVTLGSCKALDSDEESYSTCTYTFHVPRDNGEECLPCGDEGDSSGGTVSSLKDFISNLHQQLAQKLNDLDAKLDKLGDTDGNNNGNDNQGSNNSSGAGGTNYVQWGRTSCPDTAELIYDGYIGKSYYTHGGGINYLCLPTDPEFPGNAAEGHQSQSYVYGVEYERHNSPLIDPSLHDHDAPCAVCEVQGRSQKLLLPAKRTCPSGWTKEYQGLLMAQHHTQHASDYICVADGMEGLPGGSTNANGGLLYVVEGVCGSLPCPPYIAGYEITCVLCTK